DAGNAGRLHQAGHADAAADGSVVLAVTRAVPVDFRQPFFDALLQSAAFDDLFVTLAAFAEHFGDRRVVALTHVVHAAERHGVHANRFGHFVHVTFQSKEALRATVTAERAGHGQIGVDGVRLKFNIGAAVKRQGSAAAHALHGERVRAVGAGVFENVH